MLPNLPNLKLTMIQTQNLTKTFGDLTAVDRLTLEISPGEVFGFLGPNGAGKTTTVRLLTCLIGATAGTAQVLGYQLGKDDNQIRRQVGILTETPGHYDRLTAWKNLLIFANLYEVEKPEKQAEKYLRLLGLWERRFEPAGAFSKGMRQKLAIARCLLHEPKLLFLDEPTSGLDPEMSKLVRDFISELSSEGRTIFLCTHNLDEAERLCDRVAVFKTRLRVLDTPANLRRQLYGREVVFHLRGSAQPYLSTLQVHPDLKRVQAIDNKLLITLDDPEATNPDLIRQLVQAGADLQFVGELRHSLEDVYLKLIKE